MLRVLISFLFLASVQCTPLIGAPRFSAASPAQIRFAYENKFDDTGPGAKEPDAAYHTYKTLDEALVAYLNDPDTQLPPHEKARAIANLYRNNEYSEQPRKYSFNRLKTLPIILNSYAKTNAFDRYGLAYPKQELVPSKPMVYNGEYNEYNYQYKPHPDVEFSYDVHDKETGDSKNYQELRDGSGTVHGYYTFTENDGRSRTVTYERNPQKGYRSIQRIF